MLADLSNITIGCHIKVNKSGRLYKQQLNQYVYDAGEEDYMFL
jgi:hypothetical protein